jgi:hypothetical protein
MNTDPQTPQGDQLSDEELEVATGGATPDAVIFNHPSESQATRRELG